MCSMRALTGPTRTVGIMTHVKKAIAAFGAVALMSLDSSRAAHLTTQRPSRARGRKPAVEEPAVEEPAVEEPRLRSPRR